MDFNYYLEKLCRLGKDTTPELKPTTNCCNYLKGGIGLKGCVVPSKQLCQYEGYNIPNKSL